MTRASAEFVTAAPLRLLTVVRGYPTTAELAAVTVVISALRQRSAEPVTPDHWRVSRWAAKGQLMRPPLHPGRGAWRASALPR